MTAYRRGEIAALGKAEESKKTPGLSSLALADTPSAFHVTVIPTQPFLAIPEVSSERRDYIPIGWLEPPTVPSNLVRILPGATLWHFAILTSHMHMAWMRQIGGRLESRYRYSIGLVYNNFPWPEASVAQRAKIETLALADLYDPDTMPASLRKAHHDLDLAIDRLYRKAAFGSDRERVEYLFTLYQRLIDPLHSAKNRRAIRQPPSP